MLGGGAFEAGFWGLVAGSALIIGAVFGYYLKLSPRVIGSVLAFGAGVLISVLAFDLIEEAYEASDLVITGVSFVTGAVIYTLVNIYLERRGADDRMSAEQEPASQDNGLVIAAGALLDGIPESIVIGLSLLYGGTVSAVAVIAIFVSNIPEGMSSAAGMRSAGRRPRYVFGVWIGIAVASGIAAMLGYAVFGGLPVEVTAAMLALAAGGVLAMVADTMIPEAFESAHEFTGLIAVAGFLVAFVLSKLGG
ncbi:MAG TPA: hypothetical protein VEX62_11645 [Candidatus Limnocylindrales bacterium]|nr:hypothetical protein [Candidatus Limnocylindrales bacterium]